MLKTRLEQFDRLENTLSIKEKVANKAILQRTLEEISRIRANQNKMEQDLENVCRTKYQDILGFRQKLQDMLSDIKGYCEFTETVVNRGQDLQVVVFSCVLYKISTNTCYLLVVDFMLFLGV